MNTKVAIALLVALSLLAFAAGWRMRPDAEPTFVEVPPLPAEVVRVEVVKEIPVPGPERVIERVRWRTKEVEVPGPTVEVLRDVVCPGAGKPVLPRLVADVSIDAEKYEGEDPAGKPTLGWSGLATCSVAEVLKDGPSPPVVLAMEPFDLSASIAQSTVPPLAGRPEWERHPRRTEVRLGATTAPGVYVGLSKYGSRRLGWFAAASVDFSPEEFTRYASTGEGDLWTRERAESVRVAAGLAWSFGRR